MHHDENLMLIVFIHAYSSAHMYTVILSHLNAGISSLLLLMILGPQPLFLMPSPLGYP